MKNALLLLFASLLVFTSCKKDDPEENPTENVLRIKFQFDENQERLDNLGNTATIPNGHAAQTPDFRGLSVHFIEMIPTELTQYKAGQELYMGEEVIASNTNSFGFTTAIDFDNAIIREDGETFIEVPLKILEAGTYRHVRVSVAYQNYDIKYNLRNIPLLGDLNDQSGTIASFVGYNNHINTLTVRD
ncbi:MAG: hypothetical protein AAF570_24800, partial [Bacteroidota bacterium]